MREYNLKRVREFGKTEKVRGIEKMGTIRRVVKIEKVREVEKAIGETR